MPEVETSLRKKEYFLDSQGCFYCTVHSNLSLADHEQKDLLLSILGNILEFFLQEKAQVKTGFMPAK